MIKRIGLLLFTIALLGVLFKTDSFIKEKFLSLTLGIKREFVEWREYIFHKVTTFFNQAEQIEKLRHEKAELERYKLLYWDLQSRLERLQNVCGAKIDPRGFELKLIKMIAYRNLGDFTAAWIEAEVPKKRIFGLVTSKGVAGIAIHGESGSGLALFNGNKKCSYTVSIGSGAKGIATGSGDNRYLIVKYIPSYEKVKVGDPVYTNSYDNIFPYGIDVGKVVKVWLEGSYKVAKVRTTEDLSDPLYFWLTMAVSNGVIK
ncbi:MAG: rod shape-determining protein MreC [Epsilonproteobacteria bacterium]|nr:hypothetical protein [Campylobacterota bacterium]NPA56344.1 rod shape-determining protein MreC [Campylobacterota bacterium]